MGNEVNKSKRIRFAKRGLFKGAMVLVAAGTWTGLMSQSAFAETAPTWSDISDNNLLFNLYGTTTSYEVDGIATDKDGNVYIAVTGNNTVEERKAGSDTWTDITNGGAFDLPSGIAVDNSGDVFVTNWDNGTVMERPAGSTTWQEIMNGGPTIGPNGIAVDGSGNIYVANANGTILERQAGTTSWTDITDDASGAINLVSEIAVDGSGNIYIADTNNDTVFERQAGTTSWQNINDGATMSAPEGIAVDSAGDVFVTNTDGNSVLERKAGSNSWIDISGNGGFTGPNAIAVDNVGRIYVANKGGNAGLEESLVAPPTLTGNTTTDIDHAIDITYTDNPSWDAAITGVKVDGTALSTSDYTKSAGKIEINPGVVGIGTHTVTITATGYTDATTTSTVTSVPLAISTPSTLSNLVSGSAYQGTFTATGGIAPYTFSVESGDLPKGLTLASNGTLQGTPEAIGAYNFTVKVTDSKGVSTTQALSLSVVAKAPTETLGTIATQSIVDDSGKTLSSTEGASSATLDVPAGAFLDPIQVNVTTGTVSSALLGDNLSYVTAFGVNFDGNVIPKKPLVLTIRNAGITEHSAVYKISNGKLIPVHAVVTQGQAVLTFTSDPDFVVVNSKSGVVAGATSPETGKPFMWNYIFGTIALFLGGGLLVFNRKKRKAN